MKYKKGNEVDLNQLFKRTKRKHKAPLDGFLQYYAYKLDESRQNIKMVLSMTSNNANSKASKEAKTKESDDDFKKEKPRPNVNKMFRSYVVDKVFHTATTQITRKEY